MSINGNLAKWEIGKDKYYFSSGLLGVALPSTLPDKIRNIVKFNIVH